MKNTTEKCCFFHTIEKNTDQKVLVLLASLYWHFTWSTSHTNALTLYMSPICQNLFTITLRYPKVFVSFLTTSVSAEVTVQKKKVITVLTLIRVNSYRLTASEFMKDQTENVNVTYGNRCKLSCCYTHFPFFPKLARPKASCQTKPSNKISHTVIQFNL